MRRWIMNILLGLPAFLLSGSEVITDGGDYELTIIEETEVPLSSGISQSNEMYYLTLLVLVLFFLIAALTTYMIGCIRLRRRIQKLKGGIHKGKLEHGWNLIRLKETVTKLENQLLEKFV